jgi:hypothetical protein
LAQAILARVVVPLPSIIAQVTFAALRRHSRNAIHR